MAKEIDKWFNSIHQGDVFYAHKGAISGEAITQMLETVENQLTEQKIVSRIKKRIYNILVEALQNLYHHHDPTPQSFEKEYGKDFIIFLLKRSGEQSFVIYTANFIEKEKLKFLKDRIEQINYLNRDERKALYKLILNNQEFSEKGGGGLGLIDIARRTGNKLDYHYIPCTETHGFFSMIIKV